MEKIGTAVLCKQMAETRTALLRDEYKKTGTAVLCKKVEKTDISPLQQKRETSSAFLWKQIPGNKDSSPLQTKSGNNEISPFGNGNRKQGPQSQKAVERTTVLHAFTRTPVLHRQEGGK